MANWKKMVLLQADDCAIGKKWKMGLSSHRCVDVPWIRSDEPTAHVQPTHQQSSDPESWSPWIETFEKNTDGATLAGGVSHIEDHHDAFAVLPQMIPAENLFRHLTLV